MKIIQQDFKIITPIWFFIFLATSLFMTYILLNEDYNNPLDLIFNTLAWIMVLIFIYGAYSYSFIYEFKQKEIIVIPLFGLLSKKFYLLKNLTEVQYSINPRDEFDSINMYFGTGKNKKKISISMFQASLGDIKLFLYANVENLEEIADIEYRSTMW